MENYIYENLNLSKLRIGFNVRFMRYWMYLWAYCVTLLSSARGEGANTDDPCTEHIS